MTPSYPAARWLPLVAHGDADRGFLLPGMLEWRAPFWPPGEPRAPGVVRGRLRAGL